MSVTLRLEGPTDVLDLNGIVTNGVGYQALTGLSGIGLPPVSTQWLEGAGDGSTYRATRVLSRDIDLPLDILGADRNQLKSLISRLVMVLAAPATLYVTEPDGTEWFTKVVRVGGGEMTYGVNTIGENDAQIIVTLRAADPYFSSTQVYQETMIGGTSTPPFAPNLLTMPVSANQTLGSLTVNNVGDAPAFPVWTVTGPGSNLQLISPTGETFRWTGTLTAGQQLIVDTKTGSVTDGAGVNKYASVYTAPRFWSIKPGVSTATVSLSGPSSATTVVCAWRARKWLVI